VHVGEEERVHRRLPSFIIIIIIARRIWKKQADERERERERTQRRYPFAPFYSDRNGAHFIPVHFALLFFPVVGWHGMAWHSIALELGY
jgi:hypothetical protein